MASLDFLYYTSGVSVFIAAVAIGYAAYRLGEVLRVLGSVLKDLKAISHDVTTARGFLSTLVKGVSYYFRK